MKLSMMGSSAICKVLFAALAFVGLASADTLKINCGSKKAADGFAADTFETEGNPSFYTGFKSPIKGIYQSHRSNTKFSYILPVGPGKHDVTFYFAENFGANCEDGKRVFDIKIGDKALQDIDVFKKVGCDKPTKEFMKGVEVSDETMTIEFTASAQKAFVSGIEVTNVGSGSGGGDGGTPSTGTPADTPAELKMNLGSTDASGDYVGESGVQFQGGPSIYKANSKAGGIYTSHRSGKFFTMDFKVSSGPKDIVLHFAEIWKPNCAVGKRVFSVKSGGKQFVDFDPFAAAGCEKGTTKTLKGVEVKNNKLFLTLSAKENQAFVSGIEVLEAGSSTPADPSPAAQPSAVASAVAEPSASPSTGAEEPSAVPSADGGVESPAPQVSGVPPALPGDTGSHSVPGVYDTPVVDFDGDGEAEFTIDGSGSHTHHIDSDKGEAGFLTKFVWTNKSTKETICADQDPPLCKATFPVGANTVELCVTDNTGDTNCAETLITVVGSSGTGGYCYYYDLGGDAGTKMPLGKDLESAPGAKPKPLFGAATGSLQFEDAKAFPDFGFKANSWAQRCVFFLEVEKTSTFTFTAEHIGGVSLYVGDTEVLSADAGTNAATKTTTGETEIPAGLQSVVLLYHKIGSKAQMKLAFDGGAMSGGIISYDLSAVLPILSSITPAESDLSGAAVKILGINISDKTKVLFGEKESVGTPLVTGNIEVQAQAPAVDAEQVVEVVLENAGGTSNSLKYSYNKDGPAPVKFGETTLKSKGGTFGPNGVTNIAMGPDFKYYMPTLFGKIIVAEVDHEGGYNVKSTCESAEQTDPKWNDHKSGKPAARALLGIAFNPVDTGVKAYISSSTLYWGENGKDILNDDFAWANGNIESFVPSGGGCMQRDDFVVTGIPVSNHDHAINGLVFNNNGDLIFQVGGFTNAGIPGEKLGNEPENPLSGASLIALLSKSGFNGAIKYDNTDGSKAKQIGGDVEVYSPGFRNSFGLTLHSNGNFYATDNGPNFSFGAESTSCTANGGEVGSGDKVVLVKKGKYYGHPNRNRGGSQCTYVDDNGKTPDNKDAPASFNYEKPWSKIESSSNGIMEYTANTFGGQLRGDLFVSKYASNFDGKLFRFGVNEDGTKNFGPDQFHGMSGLSIAQGHRGEIMMPKVFQKKVVVLEPQYPEPASLQIVNVAPFRGKKGGGNTILISGHNFGDNPTAKVGTGACIDVKEITATSFKCTAPGGSGLVEVTVTADGATATAPSAFWYMDV